MLAKTGLTVADHQRLTIERYDALLACDVAGVRIMPVLQGYAPADYAEHVRAYGDRLKPIAPGSASAACASATGGRAPSRRCCWRSSGCGRICGCMASGSS
jgi:hypothetical protein